MSTTEIQESIRRLPKDQFADLREWILALDADRWDEQFERDAMEGKLDDLADAAIEEDERGETSPL